MSLFGDLIVLSQAQVPVMIGTTSPLSVGIQVAAQTMGAPASATYPTANLAILIPFNLPRDATIVKLWANNGATLSGNIDVGIYDDAFAKIVSIGSTVQAGTANQLQEFDITDTTMIAGRYYLVVALDNTTATLMRFTPTVASSQLRQMGCAQMAAAFPLPATITPAIITNFYLPLIGLSLRTLVQ